MGRERRRFRMRLWPTVGTVVGLAILISLGTWQLGRYRRKLTREKQRAARLDNPPISVDSLADFQKITAPYTPVTIHGTFDPDYTFLFKHRVHHGDPGAWVGGVLRFARGDGVILVNRGWVQREHVRSFAGQPPPTDEHHFEGLIHIPDRIVADSDARRRLAAGDISLEDSVTRWDTYDLKAISDALPMPTPADPQIVVLGPDHSGDPFPVASYDYITQPYLTSDRHFGYMVFWYGTAVALLAMYVANGLGYLGSFGRRRRR